MSKTKMTPSTNKNVKIKPMSPTVAFGAPVGNPNKDVEMQDDTGPVQHTRRTYLKVAQSTSQTDSEIIDVINSDSEADSRVSKKARFGPRNAVISGESWKSMMEAEPRKEADWYIFQHHDISNLHRSIDVELCQSSLNCVANSPIFFVCFLVTVYTWLVYAHRYVQKYSDDDLRAVHDRAVNEYEYQDHYSYCQTICQLNNIRKHQLMTELNGYKELLNVKKQLGRSRNALQNLLGTGA